MTLKILLLLGAVAPVVLVSQHVAAARRAHGFIVAQQQTDANKTDADKTKHKKKNEAKKKDRRKERAKRDQTPVAKQGEAMRARKNNKHDRKSGQQSVQKQPAANAPATVKKDNAKRGERQEQKAQVKQQKDKAERKQDRNKNKRPAARQQTQPPAKQPTATQQPSTAEKHGKTAAKQKRLDQLRIQRKETREGNRTVIREQNRTIIREDGRALIRHDDSDRFRRGARSVREERRGGHRITVVVRPDGTRITTLWSDDGRILRRSRRAPGGREYVLYENRERGRHRDFDFVVRLGPFALHIPRDRYIVDADRADRILLYDTLVAGPLVPIARPYTLDEIRYSYDLRERMRRIDLDTINFESGSWEVTPYEARRLEPIAEAMWRAIRRNPDEVFLIEGHTDAVGSPIDNLSLSDRRAEAVAEVLTELYGIPPENLITQGYGEEYLKVPTPGPDRRNRRVTIRRITPLLRGRV